jgi:hypothetical protein
MLSVIGRFLDFTHSTPRVDTLSLADHHYAAHAYPSNHTYKIKPDKLIPKPKLAKRYDIIANLFPDMLTSYAGIGSSKGYFVFAASAKPSCTRALGIDVNPQDIHFTQRVQRYLNNNKAQFASLHLHELAERIYQFGGEYQVVDVLNIYQYLYFGSEFYPHAYLDHDFIFQCLRDICSHRIIFNNRIALDDVQLNPTFAKASAAAKSNYNEKAVRKAAARYFTIKEAGFIGRYPLWCLDVK